MVGGPLSYLLATWLTLQAKQTERAENGPEGYPNCSLARLGFASADGNYPLEREPGVCNRYIFRPSQFKGAVGAGMSPSRTAWQTYSCNSQPGARVKTRLNVYGLVKAFSSSIVI
jgi:hypothetical protein